VSAPIATRAPTASSAIITAIGTAVSLPATPTSGAAAAPITNWSIPSSADALPADSG
jgi:hypothetical protein